MLTMVTAQNVQSGLLLLPLTDSSGGYSVKDIQGLDPVKAALVSSSIAQMDGEQLQNARRGTRNITMKLGLEANYVSNTVADLRTNLYRWFMPKKSIAFNLYFDDVLTAVTEATVESCDNNMFSSDPEVDISLICYDPDFYAPEPVRASLLTVSDSATQIIKYDGTSDTGVLFTLVFPQPAESLVLYNSRPDRSTNIVSVNGAFIANDKLVISTVPGSKAVTVTRNGLDIPVLGWMDSNSTWVSLEHGDNLFRAFFPGVSLPYSLEYTEKYGGF